MSLFIHVLSQRPLQGIVMVSRYTWQCQNIVTPVNLLLNVRLACDHLFGKLLFTWLSLVMSMMVSFVLSFFPRDVLDEILNLIESVSEDFPSYSFILSWRLRMSKKQYLGGIWTASACCWLYWSQFRTGIILLFRTILGLPQIEF